MRKKIVNIILGISVIATIGWCIGYYCGDNYGEKYTKYKNQANELKNDNQKLQDKNRKLNQEVSSLIISSSNSAYNNTDINNSNANTNEPNTFTAGVYTIGNDIETGTYDVEWISGNGQISWNGKNIHSELMGSRDGYIKRYSNMSVENGVKFEVTSDLKVKLVKK